MESDGLKYNILYKEFLYSIGIKFTSCKDIILFNIRSIKEIHKYFLKSRDFYIFSSFIKG